MQKLNQLRNVNKRSSRKRVGRGIGTGNGKTSGRGEKGAGSRSGYTRRLGYEGGQFRQYMKMPIRGFSNAQFRKELHSINLDQIEQMYNDGDVVNMASLREEGYISGPSNGLKILGNGELKKKVTIEANAVSKGAQEKLEKAKISVKMLGKKAG